MNKLVIRTEAAKDYDAVTDLIDRAFKGKPYAGGDESEVVLRLRACGALTLGLVAELDGKLIGQITFSPVTNQDGTTNWYALGPVSVSPDVQSQGVGGQLINKGIAQIKDMGGVGCMLTGNPVYYSRFGFEFSHDNAPANEPPEYFMVKRLNSDNLPSGPMSFHPAFYGSA